MTYGFGMVGSGVIAAVHAEAIATLPGAALVAVTDVAAAAAATLASRRTACRRDGGRRVQPGGRGGRQPRRADR